MKKFLVLQLRPEDEATRNEFDAILHHGVLSTDEVHQIRMEVEGVPSINLDDYSGVLVGGGPYNISDSPDKKPEPQVKLERELGVLMEEILRRDFPYLGACYGIGILNHCLGGAVSKERYNEDVGAVEITLTEEGLRDPLLRGVASPFTAFVGHKEACQSVPDGAVHLASSPTCPVQMFRTGKNVYATQFHPELDVEGLCARIDIYKHAGYFHPEDADKLKADARSQNITEPMKILRNFVDTYRS